MGGNAAFSSVKGVRIRLEPLAIAVALERGSIGFKRKDVSVKRLLIALFAASMLIAPTHAYAEPDAEPTSDEQAIAVDIDAVGEDAGTEAPLGEDAASASIAPADVPEPIPSSDASSTDGSNPASTDGSNAADFDESADPEQSVIPAEPSDADELGGEDSEASSGWVTIDGFTYFVDPQTGELLSDGIFEIDGESYYLRPAGSPYGPEGSLGSGWVRNYGGNTYFFDRETGRMYSDGIYDIDGSRYYFRPKESPYGPVGSMGSGWVLSYGEQELDYFFDRSSAAMVFGRADIDGSSYYFDSESGAKQTGWAEFDGNRYCYAPDGKMLSDGIYEVDGSSYFFRPARLATVGYGTSAATRASSTAPTATCSPTASTRSMDPAISSGPQTASGVPRGPWEGAGSVATTISPSIGFSIE